MFIRIILAAASLALITDCSLTRPAAADTPDSRLDVSVLYRERIMLPPGSQLEVALTDVSKMDVPAEVISLVTQDITTGPPYNVSLTYSADQIQANHRYSLKAKISNSGTLMFISTSAVDPFASGTRPVEVMVQRTASKPATPDSTLKNTHWRLISVKGKNITLSEGQKEPFMLLEMDSARIRGFSGCNYFTGTYKADGNKLSFPQVAATMKMCIKGMEHEQLFLAAINKTEGYEIAGEHLKLIDNGGTELALFKAIYLQ